MPNFHSILFHAKQCTLPRTRIHFQPNRTTIPSSVHFQHFQRRSSRYLQIGATNRPEDPALHYGQKFRSSSRILCLCIHTHSVEFVSRIHWLKNKSVPVSSERALRIARSRINFSRICFRLHQSSMFVPFRLKGASVSFPPLRLQPEYLTISHLYLPAIPFETS